MRWGGAPRVWAPHQRDQEMRFQATEPSLTVRPTAVGSTGAVDPVVPAVMTSQTPAPMVRRSPTFRVVVAAQADGGTRPGFATLARSPWPVSSNWKNSTSSLPVFARDQLTAAVPWYDSAADVAW